MMTIAKSADGVEGCLIRGHDGTYYFRVYDADHNFRDYDVMHSDLSITITDPEERNLSTAEIAHRMSIDVDLAKMAIDIINQLLI
jgi:hypothetical protein